jgi:ribonuclease HI
MTRVIHCDASSKEGFSSWAFKIHGAIKPHCGIVQSMNTCLAETLAVIKAIEVCDKEDEILIISDNFTAVDIVQRTNNGIEFHSGRCKKFKKIRDKLVKLVKVRCIDAVWIASNNKNESHQEIDTIAKFVLNEYLKGLK